jgi:hypothetical protein
LFELHCTISSNSSVKRFKESVLIRDSANNLFVAVFENRFYFNLKTSVFNRKC